MLQKAFNHFKQIAELSLLLNNEYCKYTVLFYDNHKTIKYEFKIV